MASGQNNSSSNSGAGKPRAPIPMAYIPNAGAPKPAVTPPPGPVGPVDATPAPAEEEVAAYAEEAPAEPQADVQEEAPVQESYQESSNQDSDAAPAEVDAWGQPVGPAAPAPRRIPRPPPPQPFMQKVGVKRTMIPLLLTTGVCMVAIGLVKFLVPADSPLAQLPMFFWLTFLCISPLMFFLAVITMLQVRHQLAAEKAKATKA